MLFIKEDRDLRGRKPGEVANIIYEQALKEGKSPSNLKIALKEEEAFRQALLAAGEGDIVVVFYEEAEPLRNLIAKMKIILEGNKDVRVYNVSLEV